MHKEVCIKVNVFVDEKIAPVVEALSKIDNLITIFSCQNHCGNEKFERARVQFKYDIDDDWEKLGEVCQKLTKSLSDIDNVEILLGWRTNLWKYPHAFLYFNSEDANRVASSILDLSTKN